MCPEEGGNTATATGSASAPQQHLLVPGGDEIEVDSEKIYEFVKRYAEFRMLEVVKEPLEVSLTCFMDDFTIFPIPFPANPSGCV